MSEDNDRELIDYLIDIYHTNDFLEKALSWLEKLKAQEPDNPEILKRYRERHCELSKKQIEKGQASLLLPA